MNTNLNLIHALKFHRTPRCTVFSFDANCSVVFFSHFFLPPRRCALVASSAGVFFHSRGFVFLCFFFLSLSWSFFHCLGRQAFHMEFLPGGKRNDKQLRGLPAQEGRYVLRDARGLVFARVRVRRRRQQPLCRGLGRHLYQHLAG